MVTFWTDADLVGHGEFVEAQVSLATEFTLSAGSISRFRWHFPAVAPSVTPAIRLYNAAGALVASVPFDTGTLDAWNWATPGSPISVTAGTYRATVTTTRYPALSGFFSGPITRGPITAVQGRFTSGDAAPTSASTAAYFVDVDFTAGVVAPAQGSAGAGLDLAVAAAGGRDSAGVAAAGVVFAVAASGRAPARGSAAVELSLGVDARSGRAVVRRPDAGVVARPFAGVVVRP